MSTKNKAIDILIEQISEWASENEGHIGFSNVDNKLLSILKDNPEALEALSRQPAQTEDLEAVEQHAVEWWNLESTRQIFPDPVPNPIGMATDFYRFIKARSISEPK